MAASVLGKRTRRSADITDADSGISTRAKRRVNFVILDENEKENPFITSDVKDNGGDMEVDDLTEPVKSVKRSRTAATVPAKHGAPESRVALSPLKKVAHVNSNSTSTTKVATPSTPRHRDALRTKVAVTPRHRFIVAGQPLTPQTPRTPGTPRTSVPTVYNEARQLFARGSTNGPLVGRENERKELLAFVSRRVERNASGCIYVSGPPGTGKSAQLNETLSELNGRDGVNTAYVNCMVIKSAREIFAKLLEEFTEETDDLEGNGIEELEHIFSQQQRSYVVTLDEIDHLLDVDMKAVYKLFEWSFRPKSSLVLVGIANALDFTDRFLPRLKARGLKPQLLPFMPYTAQQIASIVTSKLQSLVPSSTTAPANFVPFVHPTAILFLSKKVAAQTGDLRKAFDICRRAIDAIESETKDLHTKKAAELTPSPTPSPSKTPLVENMNLSSPPVVRSPSELVQRQSTVTNSLSQLKATTAPRATIAHVAKITATIFSNGTSQRLASLNLQQKAVLCSITALERSNRTAQQDQPTTPSRKANVAPTIRGLYAQYASLLERENLLHPLTSTEFRDVIGSLETASLITAVDGKNTGAGSLVTTASTPSRRGRGGGFAAGASVEDRRVSSVVGVKELRSCLEGVGSGILKGMIEDVE